MKQILISLLGILLGGIVIFYLLVLVTAWI